MGSSRNSTPPKETEFSGDLCLWQVEPDVPVRRWTTLNLPFSEVVEWFFIKEYEDKAELAEEKDIPKEGFQRGQAPAHVSHIYKDMSTPGRYTPVGWAGGVFPWHEKNLKIDATTGRVSVKVTSKNKLPLIDGGHREAALIKKHKELTAALEKAKTEEEKAKIQKRLDLVNKTTVTIQLFLDHKYLQQDFLNLQKGKPADKNMVKSIEERHGLVDPDVLPVVNIGRDVAHCLAEDKDSFIYGQVKFDASSTGKPIQYSSVTTAGPSELATSFVGGAKIALSFDPKHDAPWLEKTYNEAYYAIQEYGEKDPEDSKGKRPALFRPDHILTPTLMNKGTRGGVALLIGLGNMLAWRKGFRGQETATEDDLKQLVKAAEAVMNKPHSGQSASDKRALMLEFAQEYFMDFQQDYADPNLESVGLDNGVPLPLLSILNYSTFGLQNPNRGTRKPKDTTPPSPPANPKTGRAKVTKQQEAALAG